MDSGRFNLEGRVPGKGEIGEDDQVKTTRQRAQLKAERAPLRRMADRPLVYSPKYGAICDAAAARTVQGVTHSDRESPYQRHANSARTE